MQICQLFVAFRTDALVCPLKKLCLNLLKGSQNSFLGLQPESGRRHSTGPSVVRWEEERKSPFLCGCSALFAPPAGQSGLMTGPGARHLGFAPQTRPPGVGRRPTGSQPGSHGAFSGLRPFGLWAATVPTHIWPLHFLCHWVAHFGRGSSGGATGGCLSLLSSNLDFT